MEEVGCVGVEEDGDGDGDAIGDVVVASVSRNSEAGAGGPMPSHTVNTHTHPIIVIYYIDPASVSSSHLEEVLPLPDLDIFTGRYVSIDTAGVRIPSS